ncbi:MAG TPA: ATP-binding cassette domain-containing protein, partial [Deltaproteobacteria bacterium]|nr:ATP-binding cassette domain-containing protein [Deltaproteobacteria bacterium]
MISLKGVSKTFNRGRPDEFTAVKGLNLEIGQERVVVFKGPSGSGKTTLLSIIGCMAKPTAGRVFIGDEEISSLPDRFLTEIRRGTFGFIFQQLNLIQGITALENVMLPAYPTG